MQGYMNIAFDYSRHFHLGLAAEVAIAHATSSSSAFASFKTGVSKPSMNRL
jgi:hypothetical protein